MQPLQASPSDSYNSITCHQMNHERNHQIPINYGYPENVTVVNCIDANDKYVEVLPSSQSGQVSALLTLSPLTMLAPANIFQQNLCVPTQIINSVEDKVIQDSSTTKNSVHASVENDVISHQPQNYEPEDAVFESQYLEEQPAIQISTKDNSVEYNKLLNYFHIADRLVAPRALAVLPPSLQFKRNIISPCKQLGSRMRFGPVEGIDREVTYEEACILVFQAASNNTPIFLFGKTIQHIMHKDVSDQDKSNWLSLLQLGDQNSANVWLYEEDGKLYGITNKPLAANAQLFLGYSKMYAQQYGIPESQPIFDVHTDLLNCPRRWRCQECFKTLSTTLCLQRHIDYFHKDVVPGPMRRYRCWRCRLTFTRRSILKKHCALYCSKRHENTEIETKNTSGEISVTQIDVVNKTTQTDIFDKSTQTLDDTTLLSDDSLQSCTNNLEFTTNLLDPDNITNLDISIDTGSDSDFNTYLDKHDLSERVTNDVNVTQAVPNEIQVVLIDTEIHTKEEEIVASVSQEDPNTTQVIHNENPNKKSSKKITSCPHCSKVLRKGEKLKHIRECKAKRLTCQCGRVFTDNDKLSKHILLEHTPKENKKEVEETLYECGTCRLPYKRRGMLVNHMSREHGTSGADVPLVRTESLYTCASCPKLYRTAAKRDIHTRMHHSESPAGEGMRLKCGERECAAAACSACPRQYATRAKLLQHMRQNHPELALPVQKKKKTTEEKVGVD